MRTRPEPAGSEPPGSGRAEKGDVVETLPLGEG